MKNCRNRNDGFTVQSDWCCCGKMNTTLAASANSEKVLRKSLKSTHLVTAAYSSVRLTTEHSHVNRWEFYSEHQPISQCRLIFFMPSHPKPETKCQHFTGIWECLVPWYLWNNAREVRWKSKKGMKSFSVQGLMSGLERGTKSVCCQRTPFLPSGPRDWTFSHSGENSLCCARSKEEGACGGGK